MPGNYSPGEKMLLANAGVQNADPDRPRRAAVRRDSSMQGADPELHRPHPGQPGQGRACRQEAGGRPPDKSSGGWFDWF